MKDPKFEEIKDKLNYLERRIDDIELQLGFNHSGTKSIKARLELLESYCIVNDHNEFNSLFGDVKTLSSENLLRSYLKLKIDKMYRIISIPPIFTSVPHHINELYNHDKFPPYDELEKLSHQCLLLLLLSSPSFTVEDQSEILTYIFHLRRCYVVQPGIIDWVLTPNVNEIQIVQDNYKKISDKISE